MNPAELHRILRLLANGDPEAYDRLVEAFQQHVAEVTVAVTDADPSNILVLQGRAQEARKILIWLKEAREPPKSAP